MKADRGPYWRRRLLAPVLALTGLNAAVFAVYTLPRTIAERTSASRLAALRAEVEHERVRSAARTRREETLARNAQDTQRFYEQIVGDRASRLVPLLSEIETAAKEQGLGTKQGSYSPSEVKGAGLTKFEIRMPLSGNYRQLVSFLDRIERSSQFLIVEDVRLAERRGAGASLDVGLSTYFREESGGGRGR